MYGFTAISWALGAWYTCRAYLGGPSAPNGPPSRACSMRRELAPGDRTISPAGRCVEFNRSGPDP